MASDLFFRETPAGEFACGDTGYFLRMSWQRDGNALYLRHESKEISKTADRNSRTVCYCSDSCRPLTPEEYKFYGNEVCPNVVLWAISWSDYDDQEEIDGLGRKRNLLEKFFQFYQGVSGVGCYINGEPKRALVEVTFGTAWYGINH